MWFMKVFMDYFFYFSLISVFIMAAIAIWDTANLYSDRPFFFEWLFKIKSRKKFLQEIQEKSDEA